MKIGHFCHIWYTDIADEFAECFSKTPVPYELHITTAGGSIKQVQHAMSSRQIHTAIMHGVQNIGRDIYPLVCVLGPIMKSFDLICFTHSKKSTHAAGGLGDSWRRYLLRNLAGSSEIMTDIIRKFEANPRLGILYPDHFQASMSWGKNYNIARVLAVKMGLGPLSPDRTPDFCPGTMFWVRPRALQKLFNLKLTMADFAKAFINNRDGTICQAIERLITLVVTSSGYILEKYTPLP